MAGRGQVRVDECVIERQCEDAFIDILAARVPEYDAVCSLGCGAGVQALAERFPKTPIYPGLNTQFIGILESQGVWTEKCAGCGNCRLGEFAGICPITRCAKHLLNGPCGGSQEGKCEVNPDLECGWQLIYDRASSLGIVDSLRGSCPRTTGPPAWTADRGKWSARTSASPGWDRQSSRHGAGLPGTRKACGRCAVRPLAARRILKYCVLPRSVGLGIMEMFARVHDGN